MNKKINPKLGGACIIYSDSPSKTESFAARELQRYIYLLTGSKPSILPADQASLMRSPLFLIIGDAYKNLKGSKLYAPLCSIVNKHQLKGEDFLIKMVDVERHTLVLLLGGTPLSTLYAVYTFLEQHGVGFYLGGDTWHRDPDLRLKKTNVITHPKFEIRGTVNWPNFLNSVMTWNLADYQSYFDHLVKMKMNLFFIQAYTSQPTMADIYNLHLQKVYTPAEPISAIKTEKGKYLGKPWATSDNYPWGTVKNLPTSSFGFGTSCYFDSKAFGADVSVGKTSDKEKIRKTQIMVKRAFNYAKGRGIHVCIGFELIGNPFNLEHVKRIKAIIRHLLDTFPMIDYICFWQSEDLGRTGVPQQLVTRLIESPGWKPYYKKMFPIFSYLEKPERIIEAIRMCRFIEIACEYVQTLSPEIGIVVGGWGGDQWLRFSDFFLGMDKALPSDIVFSALDNIDPAISPYISHVYGELSRERKRWPILWFESDGGGLRRDQWAPQPNVKPFERLLKDARNKKCQGVIGCHWRTRSVEEVASYTANFSWSLNLQPKEFFKDFALCCYGPHLAKEMAKIHEDLENLGPRWSGLLGQVECNDFKWFNEPNLERKWKETFEQKRSDLIRLRDRLKEILAEIKKEEVNWTLERAEYLAKMADWILYYDEVCLELREDGPVNKLLKESEQALKNGDLTRTRSVASEAWERIHRTPLEKAMRIYSETVSNRGELGVLATINLKAYASYLSIEKRARSLLGDIRPPARLTIHEDNDTLCSPPVIKVPTLPPTYIPGEAFEVRAIIPSKRVKSVYLHYGTLGERKYRRIGMQRYFRCNYRAKIPEGKLNDKGLEFYIEALDTDGNRGYAPFPHAVYSALPWKF